MSLSRHARIDRPCTGSSDVTAAIMHRRLSLSAKWHAGGRDTQCVSYGVRFELKMLYASKWKIQERTIVSPSYVVRRDCVFVVNIFHQKYRGTEYVFQESRDAFAFEILYPTQQHVSWKMSVYVTRWTMMLLLPRDARIHPRIAYLASWKHRNETDDDQERTHATSVTSLFPVTPVGLTIRELRHRTIDFEERTLGQYLPLTIRTCEWLDVPVPRHTRAVFSAPSRRAFWRTLRVPRVWRSTERVRRERKRERGRGEAILRRYITADVA